MKTRYILPVMPVMMALVLFCVEPAFAVPETVGARVSDVTTTSFSVVWMTDVEAEPGLEVAQDQSMSNLINDSIDIMPMAGALDSVATAAKAKGVLKVSAVGLEAGKTYYVRAVTKNSANESDVGYSTVLEVTMSQEVRSYRDASGTARGFSNDIKAFPVYVRPSELGDSPGMGDLIILEADGSSYPVSAFAGDGVGAPKGLIDLNNAFGEDGLSLDLAGGERLTLRVYKGDLVYTLTHFRKVKTDSNMVYVSEPEKGFFADINIDGNVDDGDFEYFKEQYRTLPDDTNYNPDYNFVADTDSRVDVREFSKFALEYGRTDVE